MKSLYDDYGLVTMTQIWTSARNLLRNVRMPDELNPLLPIGVHFFLIQMKIIGKMLENPKKERFLSA